jgi:hypothetical protein
MTRVELHSELTSSVNDMSKHDHDESQIWRIIYNNVTALGERPETGSFSENMLLSQQGSPYSVALQSQTLSK